MNSLLKVNATIITRTHDWKDGFLGGFKEY